jgi:hypothetical protein
MGSRSMGMLWIEVMRIEGEWMGGRENDTACMGSGMGAMERDGKCSIGVWVMRIGNVGEVMNGCGRERWGR